MKVIECGPKKNRVWYLCVYTLMPRSMFVKVLERLPDIRIVRRPVFLSVFREDVFLEFSFKGENYYVEVDPFSKTYFEIHLNKEGCKPETVELKQKIQDIKFPYLL